MFRDADEIPPDGLLFLLRGKPDVSSLPDFQEVFHASGPRRLLSEEEWERLTSPQRERAPSSPRGRPLLEYAALFLSFLFFLGIFTGSAWLDKRNALQNLQRKTAGLKERALREVFVFRNGALVRGRIISRFGGNLVLETRDGVFQIHVEEVKRFIYSNPPSSNNVRGEKSQPGIAWKENEQYVFKNGLIIRGQTINQTGSILHIMTRDGDFKVHAQDLKKVKYIL